LDERMPMREKGATERGKCTGGSLSFSRKRSR
jgi:hypothetical protein